MPLTDAACRAAQPGEQLPDGKGLFLVCNQSEKRFVLRYKCGDKWGRARLGTYPAMKLAEARAQAMLTKKALKNAPEVATAVAKPAPGITLKAAWAAYMTRKGNTLSRPKSIQKSYDDVLAPMGSRDLASITEDDLTDALQRKYDAMIAAGRTGRGIQRIRTEVSAFFTWCRRDGRGVTRLKTNPMTDVPVLARPIERERFLDERELRWCLMSMHRAGEFARPFEFALRSGLRIGNPFDLTKAMLVLDDAEQGPHAVLPASVMKNGQDHALPLPPQLFRLLPDLTDHEEGERLWRSPRGGHLAADAVSNAKERVQAAMQSLASKEGWNAPIEHWTIHDWRRSISSIGNGKLKIAEDLMERILAHKIAGVKRIYNRWSYFDEKRDALKKWNDFLDGLISVDE